MSELSDGEREKPPDRNDGSGENLGSVTGDNTESNLKENASQPRMVESSQKSSSASGDAKHDRSKSTDKVVERKYESKDKIASKLNGVKTNSSRSRYEEPPRRRDNYDDFGRNRRDDDYRRLSPTKPLRKPESKSSSGGSTIFSRRDVDTKRNFEPSKPFQDESRLSKLIRRLQRETERERRLLTAKQLLDYMHTADGAKWAVKSADDMLAVFQDVLFERGYKDVKHETAVCIGMLGSLMGSEAERYFQWLFGQINGLIEDDVRALFLLALQETLKFDEKKQATADFTNMVLSHLQTLLENADTPELLMSVVTSILYITKGYPHVFSGYFRDTVDILVGWHIDLTQKNSLIEFTSNTLIAFEQFWVTDLYFTKDLLGQFLEDMEAYTEDLSAVCGSVLQPGSPAPDEIIKITALLKVFSTVIKSLGSDFTPSKTRQFDVDYVVEVFDKTVRSVTSVVRSFFSEFFILEANHCLSLLLGILRGDVVRCHDALLPYILTLILPTRELSYKLSVSTLKLLNKAIEMIGTQLPVGSLAQILAPGSLLNSLILSQSDAVQRELMSTYHRVLGLRSVPLMEEAYRYILGSTEQAYNRLLEACGETERLELVTANPFRDVTYQPGDAETTCIFNLCVLGEIANAKSNIIGMWALSPSIFELYSARLNLCHPTVGVQYPAVQFALIHALYAHASRHGNFISTSVLLTQNTALEGSVLANVNPATSGNFSRVLLALSEVLTNSHTSYDSRCLCLKWVSEIITSLHTSQHVFLTRQFLTLIQALYQAGYDQETSVAQAVQHCLTAIYKNPRGLPGYIVRGCVKLCMCRLTDRAHSVRDAYFHLLNLLPLNVTTSKNNGLHMLDEDPQLRHSELVPGLAAMWRACRNHMGRPPLGTFHSHNFRHVMGFILHNVSPRQTGSTPWLEAMYHSSHRTNNKSDWRPPDHYTMQNYMDGNITVQWFWATWEAAQFCVLSRLRTPLGKPQETFTSIEGRLKSLATEINPHTEGEEDRNKGSGHDGGDDYTSQLQVRLLLEFIEHLEKLLYNAYEGSAVAMPTSPKAVRTFFRTNKNTCLEWLSRIRLPLIQVALASGMYTIVVRHAAEMLHDMKENNSTQGGEFETVIQYLVMALCRLGDADSVQGVYVWCKDVIGRRFSWIKAAVEKASGRYEVAVKEYKHAVTSLLQMDEDRADSPRDGDKPPLHVTSILSKPLLDVSTPTPPTHKLNLFVNEIVDCYLQLSDWESLQSWQDSFHQMRSDAVVSFPQPSYNVDMCIVKALSSFDGGEMEKCGHQLTLIPGLSELNEWSLTDESYYTRCQFVRAASIIQQHSSNDHKSELTKILRQAESLSENVLRVETLDWSILMSHDASAMLTTSAVLRSQIEDKKGKTWLLPLSERLSLDASDHSISPLLQGIRLVKLQQTFSIDKKLELSEQLLQLQIGAASLARKQHNFCLAERLLLDQTGHVLHSQAENGLYTKPESLKAVMKLLHTSGSAVSQLDIISIERECSKLTHSIGDHRDAVDLLTTGIVGYLYSEMGNSPRAESKMNLCNELCARSLLTLVKWLQVDHKQLSSLATRVGQEGPGGSVSSRNLQMLLDLEERKVEKNLGLVIEGASSELKIGMNPILADTDRIIGRLLHLSTIEHEALPKSWYALAGWCYKWGRKAVDNASHGTVQLFTNEKAQILSSLPKGISEDEVESAVTVLSQIHSAMTSEEDISDQDQSQYDDGTETTRRQLVAACPSLLSSPPDCVEALLDVWRAIVHRIYHYYQLAAKAYFKFLQLNGGPDPLKEMTNEDSNVISTLRLLRLLVKHAWELRAVLEAGLAVTPTAPWKGIIPQLFSRLSHPEAYVRQSISDLLCRVAEDAPHLIVYPAVVGSSTTGWDTKPQSETGLLNNYLSEGGEGEGLEEDATSQDDDAAADVEQESSNTMLHNCLTAIVDTLAANSPRMICDVKQLIEELRRITLLWDELWLGTLNQQHQDVERRLSQLENEIRKVNNNTSLSKDERATIIREKHKTVLKPTVYTMEKLQEITSQPVDTPHERWFQDTYGHLIDAAMDKLRHPANPAHPRASWHPFKQIHVSLQQKAQKRSSLVLVMEQISPKLHSLHNTVIAMPGLGTAGQVVTIESVSNAVQILPTKTKPKKLVFKGSDGKRYPYLFKGLEDLHLDERIMQFLTIVNNMFACANKGCHQLYRARHYSVTPLGPRSGLIQWVDGLTPLFGLYKRWQQRESLAQTVKQQASGSSSTAAQTNIPRPSEIYYSKLTPALREKGIKDLENRKDWPLAVLKSVLEELMADTPRDLLAKELWCSSTGPNEWWYITQSYARSTAVMSVIGYIIGLGDRHLDNVLVDLATGEVVHIDYNVCFEKGKGLRVPERVPFRLTQNIEAALGITGVEGTFRVASEHVMKTMRKGRETLLTLLEAFVYDPLVDWTTGNESGYTGAFYGGGMSTKAGVADTRNSKFLMEREITLSMFSIRVAEMKAAWQKNRDEMLGVLPQIVKQMDMQAQLVADLDDGTATVDRLHELKQAVVAAQNDTASPVFSLHDRYKEYELIKTTQNTVHKLVEEKINECCHWHQMHQHVMGKIQGAQFQQMCADIASSLNLGTPSFAAATDFLQGAGQASVIAQCEQAESDMKASLQVQRGNLHRVIDVLHTYGTIVSQFGTSLAENIRTSNYLGWLQELVSDFTEDRCAEIIHRFHDLYGDATYPQAKVQLVVNTQLKLQNNIQDVNARLIKLLERRSLEKTDAAMLERQVQETCGAIDTFVKENGESGMSSLMAVIATALCSLNKRNLQMEAAAAGAGDRLMDLTSRDGDWFLDELCSMSGNISQFLDMIKASPQLQENDQFAVLCHGLLATHHVYVALQELNENFRTIIVPEAMKVIQAQDASAFSLLANLEACITESGQSLDSIIAQLETQHRNAIMGIKSERDEVTTTVQGMAQQFKQLLDGAGARAADSLTPGQMLLMGFDGLFTRVDDEFAKLMEAVDAMQIPEIWRKVDVVREAKSMQLSSFTVSTRSILGSLFFIRRLQVMQQFFHMCTQFAAAIQGLDGGNSYDDEQLSKSVKRFVADYVRKQVIGFPSQLLGYILCMTMTSMGLNVSAEIELKDVGAESKVPLEDLCKKAVDACLRGAQFQQGHLTQASSLTSAQDSTWRRHDLTRRLDSSIELLKSGLQRVQLHITRLHWLHEDMFLQAGRPTSHLTAANRSTVMSEMKKCMQALIVQEGALVNCQAQYSQLEASITQRLRWAAGANPSLNSTLQQFEDASTLRKQLAEEESKQAQDVISLCQGILHLEALRSRTPEALTSDTNLLALINKCNESCLLASAASSSVSDVEVALMETKPLEEGQRTDTAWLKSTLREVNHRIKDLDKKAVTLKASIDTSKDGIKNEVGKIKTSLTSHHKLMSDIRAILKSLAKQEEQRYGDQIVPGGIREYLNLYKKFSENFTLALKMVISDDYTKDSLSETNSVIETLQKQLPQIYEELMSLAPPLVSVVDESEVPGQITFANAVKKQGHSGEDEVTSLPRRPSLLHRDLLTGTPPTSSPQTGTTVKPSVSTPVKKVEKVTRDPKTGKAIQERNSYAVGVWRRVKMKLDGRDPDQNKRLSVAEQVDYVIKDATNLDNLAVLYEGWTPWV